MPDREGQLSTYRRVTSPFILDQAKLTRIIDVIGGRFQGRDDGLEIVLTALHKKGRLSECASAEELLALDNTVSNPITELEIKARNSAGDESITSYSDSLTANISIEVKSDDGKWNNETYAAIEEQVERSYVKSPFYSLKRGDSIIGLLVLGGFVFFLLFGIFSEKKQSKRIGDLDPVTLSVLTDSAKSLETSEEILKFLAEFHRAQLEEMRRRISVEAGVDSPSRFRRLLSFHMDDLMKYVFIALPLLVLFGSFAYLLVRCYPWASFSWGDVAVQLAAIETRRKATWNVLIVALLIGILANLFVLGVSRI